LYHLSKQILLVVKLMWIKMV